MNDLIIKSTREKDFTSPDILFNSDTGICLISGVSFMESPEDFYIPIIKWFKKYIVEHNSLNLIFKLSYYNTSTSKIIFDLLLILKQFEENGGKLLIEWHIDQWDNDLEDDVVGLMIDTETNIDIIKIDTL